MSSQHGECAASKAMRHSARQHARLGCKNSARAALV